MWAKIKAYFCSDKVDVTAWLEARLVGIVFLSAFISFGVQASGLIGESGILPLGQFMDIVGAQLGAARFYEMPMIFWLTGGSDGTIVAVCFAGIVFAAMLAADLLPLLCLPFLCFLYLSLIYAGQRFMTYQWDLLLVETGFVTLLMTLHRGMGIWLVRWLAFRFMFISGIVKIASGDPSWHDMTALDYHFLTQPLPTPLAWYAAKLPEIVLKSGTAATLFIELVVPFFMFGPRVLRLTCGVCFFLLQGTIFLTGNYNFFNLTAMILALSLFDDAALGKIMPQRIKEFLSGTIKDIKPRKAVTIIVAVLALWTVAASIIQMPLRYGVSFPAPVMMVDGALEPLRIVNTYGPFAVMTKKRMEIVIEGSDDGEHWKEYGFIYKPGDLMRRPVWCTPHQPRLDWQMWFAALDTPRNNPWFINFLQKILEGEPQVLALLADNPFPDKPPVFVRAAFYDYRFTSFAERRESGAAWHREPAGLYFPAVSLKK